MQQLSANSIAPSSHVGGKNISSVTQKSFSESSKHSTNKPYKSNRPYNSAPTTPEMARESNENLSDSMNITTKATDTDKKQLESAAPAEPAEKEPDDKLNLPPTKPIRSYSRHSKVVVLLGESSSHGDGG